MPTHPIKCPDCGDSAGYWQVQCRCGHFLGFPNRREADGERAELEKRHSAALTDSQRRGLEPLLAKLEALADQSWPVIAMSFAACDDIMRSGKYRNYDQRIASGERDPASAQDHSDRKMVGARLFPMYDHHIHYAALSPDGGGLSSYGPIAVRWHVTNVYLDRRISLLEENSFIFYDDHALGPRGATIPLGYRAIWENRAKLAAAKLGPRLTGATSEAALPGLLLQAGVTRKEDHFIEIAIYAEGGLDTQDVDMVTVQNAATTPDEIHRCDLVRRACVNRSIEFVE